MSASVNTVSYMFIVIQDEFNIGATNGIISTKVEMEHYKTFILYIYARDNGLPVLFSE